eukprot:3417707-Amphidinium_carterae.1
MPRLKSRGLGTCPGEAHVITGGENIRCTLYPGPHSRSTTTATTRLGCQSVKSDYFGEHTLNAQRPNVATIVASGTAPLLTLSMSRTVFEQSGLK